MDLTCSFGVEATMVANDFIDRYMAEANGEYVKVYLYILRHRNEKLDMDGIADALNHTEADVRRALAYWEKLGTLKIGGGDDRTGRQARVADRAERSFAGREETRSGVREELRPADREESRSGGREELRPADREESRSGGREELRPADREESRSGGREELHPADREEPRSADRRETRSGRRGQTEAEDRSGRSSVDRAQARAGSGVQAQAAETAASRPVYSQEQVNRLQDDGEFAQLLYIAQRYLNKIFTQRELEVFAYLYDGLHMSTEILEYLVEYCVQSGHNSIRYIETVALSWHEKGFVTVEEAKAYSSGFTKDSFSVMKAFGLTDRKPGNAEKEMIERWFKIYGFTREVVLEACNRTLEATHKPSFQYAEKILSEWKKAGVRGLTDVSALDEKRRSQGRQTARGPKKQANQFHNFEQRNTDYDSMVLDHVKEWLSE